jgi:lipoprotein NlpI
LNRHRLTLALVVLWSALLPAPSAAQDPQSIVARAEIEFERGRLAAALAGFDQVAALVPSVAPTLWQRGIVLYYLGRFDECAAQFASFHAVDPTDLENATWHFLCVARSQTVGRARATLLKAGPDRRILRTEIYELMRGNLEPEDLIAMATKSVPLVQFYAHLYVGLLAEANGDRAAALKHIGLAASDQYRPFGGFMNVVAQVHWKNMSGTSGTPGTSGPR